VRDENGANQEVLSAGIVTRIEAVLMPAPTAWPMVLALGLTLTISGMLTHWVVSLLGLVLTLRSSIGWFFEVVPDDHHISTPMQAGIVKVSSSRLTRRHQAFEGSFRKILPLETFSITSGLKGGVFGGAAMVIPAAIFGFLRYHSIWYAANLLAAGGFVSWAAASNAFLAEFHLGGLLAAIAIHSLASVLIGLLYGAMLPMFPRKPILTAGFVAPFMWTGMLYSALGVISPILNARIDWLWFVFSQIAFGLVCGFVVNQQVKVRTPQFRALPFAIRAGIHSDETDTKDNEQ
jgi:hypothetical protein